MGRESVAEIAAREAAEAEAATPDDDEAADEAEREHGDGDGDAPEDVEIQDVPMTGAPDVDKALQKLEREAERHGKRVSEIMGDDFAMLEICPLDFTPGYVMPAMAAQLPDDVKDRVRALIGDDVSSGLRDAEGVEMCPRCDGHGQLAFPTRNPHVKTQMCPRCSGQGYVNVQPPAPAAPPPNTYPPPQTYGTPPPQPAAYTGPNGGTQDAWGRLPGDPAYGTPPAWQPGV